MNARTEINWQFVSNLFAIFSSYCNFADKQLLIVGMYGIINDGRMISKLQRLFYSSEVHFQYILWELVSNKEYNGASTECIIHNVK